MPSRETILTKLNKESYRQNEVRDLINQITKHSNDFPTVLKRGDIYSYTKGGKNRPAVIIKVLKDSVISIPLSTSKCERTLCKANGRFIADSYFTKDLITTPMQEAKDRFLIVFDNTKCLNIAIRTLKAYLTEHL